MRSVSDTLDYFALLKDARNIDLPDDAKTIRLAILAEYATQHLVTMIKVLGAKSTIVFDIYEGAYDGIDLEILNPNSELYSFQPQYVVILTSSENLKNRLYSCKNRKSFVAETVARLDGLWNAFRDLTATRQSFKARLCFLPNVRLATTS